MTLSPFGGQLETPVSNSYYTSGVNPYHPGLLQSGTVGLNTSQIGKLIEAVDPQEEMRFRKITPLLILLSKIGEEVLGSIRFAYSKGEFRPGNFDINTFVNDDLGGGASPSLSAGAHWVTFTAPTEQLPAFIEGKTFSITCSTRTGSDPLLRCDLQITDVSTSPTIKAKLLTPSDTATYGWVAGQTYTAHWTGSAMALGGNSVPGFDHMTTDVWNWQQLMKWGINPMWTGINDLNWRQGSDFANPWQKAESDMFEIAMQEIHNVLLLQTSGYFSTETEQVPLTNGILGQLLENRWIIGEDLTNRHLDYVLEGPMTAMDPESRKFMLCSYSMVRALTYDLDDKSTINAGTSQITGLPCREWQSPTFGPVELYPTPVLNELVLPFSSDIITNQSAYKGNVGFLLDSSAIKKVTFPGKQMQLQSNLQANDSDTMKKQFYHMFGMKVKRTAGMAVVTWKGSKTLKGPNVTNVGTMATLPRT